MMSIHFTKVSIQLKLSRFNSRWAENQKSAGIAGYEPPCVMTWTCSSDVGSDLSSSPRMCCSRVCGLVKLSHMQDSSLSPVFGSRSIFQYMLMFVFVLLWLFVDERRFWCKIPGFSRLKRTETVDLSHDPHLVRGKTVSLDNNTS